MVFLGVGDLHLLIPNPLCSALWLQALLSGRCQGLPSLAQPSRVCRDSDGDVRRSWLCPLLVLGLAELQEFLRSSPSPVQAAWGGNCWTAGVSHLFLANLLGCWAKGGSVCKLTFIALAKLGWQCWL